MPKIIVIGDVHGHLDRMVELLQSDSLDFALQVGDFGAYLSTSNLSAIPEHRRHDLGQFGQYYEAQKKIPVPTYFCKGNHEDFELLEKYSTNREVLPNLFYVNDARQMDVLVTHEPSMAPQFTGDRPYGCQAVHDLIAAVQPRFAFSGHIHKYAEGTLGQTKCIALGAVNYNAPSTFVLNF